MRQILCFIATLLFLRVLSEAPGNRFVVWNVGQGAWSTWVEARTCWHVDMGGSRLDFADQLKRVCGRKTNYLYLTHFDADHLNFIKRARFVLPELCLASGIAASVNRRKRRLLESLPACRPPTRSPVRKIFSAAFTERNDSNMYVVNGNILVTGDAPARLEKKVLERRELQSITLYLLGHHGSRTSSSPALLQHLPHLRMTVASAEKKKYGHPHRETVHRLKASHIPLLLTEEQGTLVFIDGR